MLTPWTKRAWNKLELSRGALLEPNLRVLFQRAIALRLACVRIQTLEQIKQDSMVQMRLLRTISTKTIVLFTELKLPTLTRQDIWAKLIKTSSEQFLETDLQRTPNASWTPRASMMDLKLPKKSQRVKANCYKRVVSTQNLRLKLLVRWLKSRLRTKFIRPQVKLHSTTPET